MDRVSADDIEQIENSDSEFGLPREVEEQIPDELREDFEEMYRTKKVGLAASDHAREFESKGGEVDSIFIEPENGLWGLCQQVTRFETETGPSGRITIPKQIRENSTITDGDKLQVEMKLIDRHDEVWSVQFEDYIDSGGHLIAPRDFMHEVGWMSGLHARVVVYEEVEKGTLEEWEFDEETGMSEYQSEFTDIEIE